MKEYLFRRIHFCAQILFCSCAWWQIERNCRLWNDIKNIRMWINCHTRKWIIFFSFSDPLHFDMDPLPGMRIRILFRIRPDSNLFFWIFFVKGITLIMKFFLVAYYSRILHKISDFFKKKLIMIQIRIRNTDYFTKQIHLLTWWPTI